MTNKKKSIGIIFVMLALIFAISATAGVTFAKFISSAGVDNQKATVAQWGYTITADASKMFGENYGNVENNLASVKATKDGAVVVSATPGNNVVAPSTQGEFVLTINGTAEVNAILTIDVTESQEIWLAHSYYDFNHELGDKGAYTYCYYPIAWEVNGKLFERNISKDYEPYLDSAELSARKKLQLLSVPDSIVDFFATKSMAISKNTLARVIAEAIGEDYGLESEANESVVTVKIPANTSLNDFKVKISWDWAFHTEVTGAPTNPDVPINPYLCDEFDTLLGQYASGVELPKDDGIGTGEFIRNYYEGEKTAKFGLNVHVVQTQETF